MNLRLPDISPVRILLALLAASALVAAPAVAEDPAPEPEPTPEPTPEPAPEPAPEDEPERDTPEDADTESEADDADTGEADSADAEEAEPEDHPRVIAIRGATIHTVTGPVLEGYTLLTEDGLIDRIERTPEIPEHATVIEADGMHVYPGLVAIDTSGFIGSPPADASNPYSLTMQLALAGGITTAVNNGNVAKLTRGTLEDHVLRTSAFIDLSYNSNRPQNRRRVRESLEGVRAYLREKAAYDRRKARDPDLEEEAPDDARIKGRNAQFLALIRRQKPALARANAAYDLLELARLAEEFDFELVIDGAIEAWTVVDALARADVSVILTARQRTRPNDTLNRPTGSSIENAAILHRHGIRLGITPPSSGIDTGGDTGRNNLTLPFEAGFAVRGGLAEDAAIRAITIDAARIVGVDHRIGSIEPGKDADLIITSEPVLSYTANVEWTIVNGHIAYDKDVEPLFSHIRPREGAVSGPARDEWPRRLERPWR